MHYTRTLQQAFKQFNSLFKFWKKSKQEEEKSKIWYHNTVRCIRKWTVEKRIQRSSTFGPFYKKQQFRFLYKNLETHKKGFKDSKFWTMTWFLKFNLILQWKKTIAQNFARFRSSGKKIKRLFSRQDPERWALWRFLRSWCGTFPRALWWGLPGIPWKYSPSLSCPSGGKEKPSYPGRW